MTPGETDPRRELADLADRTVRALLAAGAPRERVEDLAADLTRLALANVPPAGWPHLLADLRADLAGAGLRLRLGEDRN